MSLAALTTLRTYLRGDAGMQAWFAAEYGKQPRHFIGYKRPVNANDFPALCYVPVRERLGVQPFDELLVSLVLCVNEPGLADDVFDGVAKLAALEDKVVALLQATAAPVSVVDGLITVTTDLGVRHPFYETELQFTLRVPASIGLDDTALTALADFATFHADYDIDPLQPQAEHEKWAAEPPVYTASRPELSDHLTNLQD